MICDLGVISEVFPGGDGTNRDVSVKTAKDIIHAYFKNRTRISVEFSQNFKIGAPSWDQLFPIPFFVKNMGKVVPPPNENGVFFFKIDKSSFYRVKR